MSVIEADNKRLRERISVLVTSRQKPVTSSEPAAQQAVTSAQPAPSPVPRTSEVKKRRIIPGKHIFNVIIIIIINMY